MKPKRLKIEVKKIGERGVVGYYWSDGIIVIDPRQTKRDFLDTAIHESLHHAFPKAQERTVSKAAGVIADVLWRLGYRRMAH